MATDNARGEGDAEAYRRAIENPEEYVAPLYERGRNQIPRRLLSSTDLVGYRCPPTAHQWKPGQSGNPRGRPKKTQSLKGEIDEFLRGKITIREGTKTMKVSALKALVLKLSNLAFKGDLRAMQMLLSLAASQMSAAPVERLVLKDFSSLSDDELRTMEGLLQKMAASSS